VAVEHFELVRRIVLNHSKVLGIDDVDKEVWTPLHFAGIIIIIINIIKENLFFVSLLLLLVFFLIIIVQLGLEMY
jgi:hypothetical protein